MHTLSNVIGGELARSQSGRHAPIFNPATGEQSAVLPLSTAAVLMVRSVRDFRLHDVVARQTVPAAVPTT